MKKLSKIVSLMLSLALCLGMASPAFAANFTDLQNAIDGKEGASLENGRTGYAAQTDESGNVTGYGIEAWDTKATDDEGNETTTRNVQLKEEVKRSETEEKGISISGSEKDVAIDLNGNDINGNKQEGSVITVTEGGKMTLEDNGTGNGKITGGTGTESEFLSNLCSGGVYVAGEGSSLVMNSGNITGNEVAAGEGGLGGGVAVMGGADFTMNGGAITENKAYCGGGVFVDDLGSTFVLNGGKIANNQAAGGGGIHSGEGTVIMHGGAITGNSATMDRSDVEDDWGDMRVGGGIHLSGGSFTMDGGSISDNTAGWAGGISGNNYYSEDYSFSTVVNITGGCIYNNKETGVVGTTFNKELLEDEGFEFFTVEDRDHSFGEWVDNSNGTRTRTCVNCGEEETENIPVTPTEPTEPTEPTPDVPETPDVPGTIIPDPDVPMADGTGTDTATIADQTVPLAGLTPVAQLLEELRQYEKVEDTELPEDFKWLDHEYAQAIYWGLREGLVVDAEDEPFDPDEVVTVALLREVLVNFVEYKGIDLTVTLAGEDDEIVFDLGERLTAFYAELEAAPKAQEPKAA